jgi:putative transposase
MKSLDDIIENSNDVREVKRALAVKMLKSGISSDQVAENLKVSPQFISKWKVIYEKDGAKGLALAYRGSTGYLTAEQSLQVIGWIESKTSLTLGQLADYLERQFFVSYKSKQSLYDLLEAGGMSWHKSEKVNPRRDEQLVKERREELKKNSWQTGRKS